MESLQKVVVLGTGHKSTVWLVRREGTLFALKEIAKAGLSAAEVTHLFSEKAAFRDLSHPGLIRLEQTYQDSSKLYFLMRVAPGAPISHLLTRNEQFSESQTRNICLQLAQILSYMRSQGYLYRDLKLSNVFWSEDGTVTVVDLGFCKKTAGERTYTVCGTRHMMSPEIFRHLEEAGEAQGYSYECDYWALGILAYELLKGRPPFGLTEDDIYTRILRGLPSVDFSGISETAKEFISALLTPDPEVRLGHNSADEIVNHPWLRSAPFPCLPSQSQSEKIRDWCEFLYEDDPISADAEDAFADF